MTEGEIEHRLTVLSEQCDHNQSRLDDVERRQGPCSRGSPPVRPAQTE